MKKNLIIIFTLIFTLTPLFPQSIKIKSISLENFPEIRVTISIESKWGVPVPVDTKKMKLFEKGKEIKNINVTPLDTVKIPIYTAIILDKSGSMKGEAITRAKQGAIEFVKMMKGEDRAAYIEFDTNVTLVEQFSLDKTKLSESINKTAPGTDTAILDGAYKGVEILCEQPQNSVKIILLLTDGKENKSKKKSEEVVKKAQESGISIFTIGLGNSIDESMLKELAVKTEANYYHAPNPEDVVNIYKKISLLVHSQLIVKFKTPYSMDDKWHKLKLSIPYMGKEISGTKAYLSAQESKISTELLKRIRDEENKKLNLNKQEPINLVNGNPVKEKENKLIMILLAALFLVILFLIIAIMKKRK